MPTFYRWETPAGLSATKDGSTVREFLDLTSTQKTALRIKVRRTPTEKDELALLLLLDALGDEAAAWQHFSKFRHAVVEHLPEDRPWELTSTEVSAFLGIAGSSDDHRELRTMWLSAILPCGVW